MARALLTLFLVIAMVFIANVQGQGCPENQEFTSCGSACPPSCNDPPNKVCTMQCVQGCQCKRGYLLNNAGNCVLRKDC